MMTAQQHSPVVDWSLLLLLLDDGEDKDDVLRANCSSSLTANDTWRRIIEIKYVEYSPLRQHRYHF